MKKVRILKYQSDLQPGHLTIKVPSSGKFLSVVNQYEMPTFYVQVDENDNLDNGSKKLEFYLVPTGKVSDVTEESMANHNVRVDFVTTLMFNHGNYIVHVFQWTQNNET